MKQLISLYHSCSCESEYHPTLCHFTIIYIVFAELIQKDTSSIYFHWGKTQTHVMCREAIILTPYTLFPIYFKIRLYMTDFKEFFAY